MTPLDLLEEGVLLALLGALGLSYLLDRFHLYYYGKHARRIIADLSAMEERLPAAQTGEHERIAASLQQLEARLTAASRRLIDWRSSTVERLIIGRHIDTLLFQYERAGAMAMRLLNRVNGKFPKQTS